MKSTFVAVALVTLSWAAPLLADDKALAAVESSLSQFKVPDDLAARAREVAKQEVGEGVQLDADKAGHAKSAVDTYTSLLFGPESRLTTPERKDLAVEMFRWGLRRFKTEPVVTDRQREESASRWNAAAGFAMPTAQEIYADVPEPVRGKVIEKIEQRLKRSSRDYGLYRGYSDLWTGDEPTAARVSALLAKGTPFRDFVQAQADQCKQQLAMCPGQVRRITEEQQIDICSEDFVGHYVGEITRAYFKLGPPSPGVAEPPADLQKRYMEYADAAFKERQAEYDAKVKADRERFKNAVDKAAKQATGVTTPGGVPKPPKPPEDEHQ